jgi:hypothetical protein
MSLLLPRRRDFHERPAARDVSADDTPASVREFERLLRSARFASSGQPWYNAERDCPNPSHNDLFGGTYALQDRDPARNTEFHGMLVQALRDGGVYGFSENRTAFSALYFDLDICGEVQPVSIEAVRRLAALVREAVLDACCLSAPEASRMRWRDASSVLAAVAPSSQQEAGLWKTGVHLIFPDIVLDREAMVRVALAAKVYVETTLGDRVPPANAWADVFDVGAYKAGLRMILVDKAASCPHCHGAPVITDATRRECRRLRCRNGRIPQGRAYRPVFFMNGSRGAEDADYLSALRQSPVLALRVASIRRPNAVCFSPERPTFEHLPPTLCPGQSCDGGGTMKLLTAALGAPTSKRLAPKIMLIQTDQRLRLLERLVRTYDARFASLVVRSATLNAAGTCYTVQVAGRGQHGCLNCLPGRSHSRATVMFLVDAEHGVTQRCTSRSDKLARMTGKSCRDFSAPWQAIRDERVGAALFRDLLARTTSLPIVVDQGRVVMPAAMIVTEEEAAAAEEEEDEQEDVTAGERGQQHGHLRGVPAHISPLGPAFAVGIAHPGPSKPSPPEAAMPSLALPTTAPATAPTTAAGLASLAPSSASLAPNSVAVPSPMPAPDPRGPSPASGPAGASPAASSSRGPAGAIAASSSSRGPAGAIPASSSSRGPAGAIPASSSSRGPAGAIPASSSSRPPSAQGDPAVPVPAVDPSSPSGPRQIPQPPGEVPSAPQPSPHLRPHPLKVRIQPPDSTVQLDPDAPVFPVPPVAARDRVTIENATVLVPMLAEVPPYDASDAGPLQAYEIMHQEADRAPAAPLTDEDKEALVARIKELWRSGGDMDEEDAEEGVAAEQGEAGEGREQAERDEPFEGREQADLPDPPSHSPSAWQILQPPGPAAFAVVKEDGHSQAARSQASPRPPAQPVPPSASPRKRNVEARMRSVIRRNATGSAADEDGRSDTAVKRQRNGAARDE